MPIRPVNGMEPLPLDSPGDVAVLVERMAKAAADKEDMFGGGLGEHFSYLAATHPEWFRPYQEITITERLHAFQGNFGDHCVLLGGAPDRCVEHLARRLRDNWTFHEAWALAGIGTEAAMTAVAEDVRGGTERSRYEELGVWVPPTGPARYRFSPHRLAAFRYQADDPAERDRAAHPVGLPLDRVVRDPSDTRITWHYVSLRIDDVPGVPDWPVERVHLVGPRAN